MKIQLVMKGNFLGRESDIAEWQDIDFISYQSEFIEWDNSTLIIYETAEKKSDTYSFFFAR